MPWSMWTTWSPGREAVQQVLGHDPPERPRPAHPHRPEQLPVGDDDVAVRATREAAVEAPVDERDATRRHRLRQAVDGRRQDVRVREQLREARRLVGGEHDPGAVAPPARHGGRRCPRWPRAAAAGSCQPNGLPPGGAPSASLSQVSSSVRASSSRFFQSRGSGYGRGPALGQLAGRLQLAPPVLALGPQEVRRGRDLRGLVEHPDRLAQVVEAGARRKDAAPQLRRVAQLADLEVGQVRGEPLAQLVGDLAHPRPQQRRRSPRSAGTPRRAAGSPRRPRPRPAGRPGRTRAAIRSHPRTTPRARAAADRPGRCPRCRRAARTRRGRRPPRPARSPAPRARGAPSPGSGGGPGAA